MPRARSPALPRCPRCGYDQSGTVATWTDQCPCRGLCPECGLDFPWRDTLRRDFAQLPWFYEHARFLAPLPLIRSLLMAITPRRFWSRVSMSHTVRPTRLALMLGLVLVLGLAGVALNRFASETAMIRWGTRFAAPSRSPTWIEAWQIAHGDDNWKQTAAKALVPYSFQMGRRNIDSFQRAHRALTNVFRVPSSALPALHVFAALLLLALPDTRAIAKVRPVHLVRAAAYPVALTIVLLNLGFMLDQWLEVDSVVNSVPRLSARPDFIAAPVGLAWAAWWWLLVCRDYLRLPRAGLVWFITMAVATFATIVLIVCAWVFVLSPVRAR